MPLTSIVIRRLSIFEIPALLRFRAKYDYKPPSDGENHTESLIYSFLKVLWHGERMVTLVASKSGGDIIGYISLIFGKNAKFKGNIYLVNAAVAATERGKGIGTRLFDEVEKYARLRGSRRVELEVFSRNDAAIRLYKRLGYEVEGIKRRAVDNGREYDDLVFMAKLLD